MAELASWEDVGLDTGVRPQVVGTARIDGSPGTQGLRLRSSSQGSDSGQQMVQSSEGLLGMLGDLTTEQHWVLVLTGLSALDLLCSGVLTCVAFSYAFQYGALSLGCVGFQILSHFVYSLLLLLRLMVDLLPPREIEEQNASLVSDEALLLEQRRRDVAREKCTNTLVGFLLIGVGCAMIIGAIRKLRVWNNWSADRDNTDHHIILITSLVAWWGFAVYLLHGSVCFAAAQKLRKRILWNGVFISVACLLFLLVLGIAAANEEEWSWKAEPIAALLLALFLLGDGGRLITEHRYNIDLRADQDVRA